MDDVVDKPTEYYEEDSTEDVCWGDDFETGELDGKVGEILLFAFREGHADFVRMLNMY
jgi:hypothetical protein